MIDVKGVYLVCCEFCVGVCFDCLTGLLGSIILVGIWLFCLGNSVVIVFGFFVDVCIRLYYFTGLVCFVLLDWWLFCCLFVVCLFCFV